MNRYEVGRFGEDAAAKYLEDEGYTIIGRNVHVGHSEFDIICKSGKYIVFAEIKTRIENPDMPDRFGRPANAVDRSKILALIRGVDAYMRSGAHIGFSPRIDVIEIYASASPHFRVLRLHHIKNAVTRNSGGYR